MPPADDADGGGGALVGRTERAPATTGFLLLGAYTLSFAAAALSEASFLAASWIFLLRVLAS
jgi:hypothetical protein